MESGYVSSISRNPRAIDRSTRAARYVRVDSRQHSEMHPLVERHNEARYGFDRKLRAVESVFVGSLVQIIGHDRKPRVVNFDDAPSNLGIVPTEGLKLAPDL